MRMLATALVILGLAATAARAEEKRCMYAQQFFAPGDVSCQDGTQFRCVAGSWQTTGLGCSDTGADDSQPGVEVDPGVHEPRVKEPSVREPGVGMPTPPTIPPK